MNLPSQSSRISRTMLALAVAISVLGFVNGGMDRGMAATVGALVSVVNWLALRWFAGRIMVGEGAARALASVLIVAKIGLLMAIVYVLINVWHLEPVGLCLGLSVLFFGPIVGGLLGGSSDGVSNPPDQHSSRAISRASTAANAEER
jgi:hypothetical protein